MRERVLPRSIVPAVGLEDRFVPSGFSFVAKHCLLKALVAVPQVAPLRATQRTEPARPQHRGARPQQERVSCVAVLRYHCERGAKAGARLDAMHARHVPTAACYLLWFGRWSGPPPPARPSGSSRGFRGVVTRGVVTHRPDFERRICQIKKQCRY